ncbi:MAG: FG-GAP-like repeat-containing protein, partial [Dehalococcoidia bacterium]
FILFGPSFDPAAALALQDPTPEVLGRFGEALTAGDVNGDGAVDVVVGLPQSDVAASVDAGRVVVFLGPAFTETVVLTDPAPEAGALFGAAVATGDLDGDGIADLIVGAPGSDAVDRVDGGQAFVFLAPALTFAATLEAPVPNSGARFGSALAIGDVSGDGVADLVVGAPMSSLPGTIDAGEAFIFLGGSPFDVAADASLRDTNPEPGAAFGAAATTTDVNNDGFADVVMGVPAAMAAGEASAGRTLVFLGPALAFTTTLWQPQPQLGARFGSALAAGDVNGDGFADVMVGAPTASADGISSGGVWAFMGPALAAVVVLPPSTPQGLAGFGTALVAADLEGSGEAEIAVGAPGTAVAGIEMAGEVTIFRSEGLVGPTPTPAPTPTSTPSPIATPTPAATLPPPVMVPLVAGWNLAAWEPGVCKEVRVAVEQLIGAGVLNVVWLFAAPGQEWLGFDPDAPDVVNTLAQLCQEDIVWIHVGVAIAWAQDP